MLHYNFGNLTPVRRHLRNTHRHNRHAMGMSLIELLVGLALGIGVLGMVVKVFTNSRQQFQVADSHARIQENARQAMQFLQDDIRMAGFVGAVQQFWEIQNTGNNTKAVGPVTGECFTTPARSFRWANPFPRINTKTIPPRLYGEDNGATLFDGCITAAAHVANTDVLSLHYAGTPSIDSRTIGNLDETFYLRSNLRGGVVFTCGGGAGGPAMGGDSIANGGVAGAAVGCIESAVGAPGMLTTPSPAVMWGSNANPDPSPETANYAIQSYLYYVRRCTDPGADGVCATSDDRDSTPALVRARIEYETTLCGGNDPCVVHNPIAEGVVAMQIEYGIDRPEAVAVTQAFPGIPSTEDFYDGNVNRYVTAADALLGGGSFDTAAEMDLWSRVLTVRVWLLIRSPVMESGYQGPNNYVVAGQNIPTDTRYRHQLFTTTITVRNFSAL